MIAEVTVPSLFGGTTWEVVPRSDAAVRALRDRHYSTKRPGGRTAGPPGRVVVLRTDDGLAAWITHYPDPELALDGLDRWRCSLFRNEGPRLSSELIVEAMAKTLELWRGTTTARGWLTYVEPSRIASPNPGYCFLRAGWSRDRGFVHPRLIRLFSPIR